MLHRPVLTSMCGEVWLNNPCDILNVGKPSSRGEVTNGCTFYDAFNNFWFYLTRYDDLVPTGDSVQPNNMGSYVGQ